MSVGNIHRVLARHPIYGIEPEQAKRTLKIAIGILGKDAPQQLDEDEGKAINTLATVISDMSFGNERLEIAFLSKGKFERIEVNGHLIFVLGWTPNERGVSVLAFNRYVGINSEPLTLLRMDTTLRGVRNWLKQISFAGTGIQ